MIVRAASGLFSQQADSLRSKIDVLYKIGLDKYTVAKVKKTEALSSFPFLPD